MGEACGARRVNAQRVAMLGALVLGGGAAWLFSRRARAEGDGGMVEEVELRVEELFYDTSSMTAGAALGYRNVRAFLDMVAFAEGTGGRYDILFGGGKFDGFADHPRVVVQASGYSSSAAGRYQFLRRTWDDLRRRFPGEYPDFSPRMQDKAAAQRLIDRGALDAILAGDFSTAVSKASKEWASLPGAGYGQPERSLEQLASAYRGAGGAIA